MTNEEAAAILESEAEFLYAQDEPYSRQAFKMAIEALQERRTSKWNLTEIHNCYEVYQCNACKREITVFHRYGFSPTIEQVTVDYPYCNCGAKMEVDE